MVAAYITLTLAEVLIYGTGLELSYTAAPQSMKGFITGCFLATIMMADLINDRMSQLYGGSLTDSLARSRTAFSRLVLWRHGAHCVAAMVGFYFVGRRLQRQSAAEAAHASE